MAIMSCQDQAKNDQKDLSTYEAEAFASLQKAKGLPKKASGKAKAKAKATSKATAKGKAKAKAKAIVAKAHPAPKAKGPVLKRPAAAMPKVANVYPGPGGPFGCIRCRGDTNGCSTCLQSSFQGTRFTSRDQWKEYRMATFGHL